MLLAPLRESTEQRELSLRRSVAPALYESERGGHAAGSSIRRRCRDPEALRPVQRAAELAHGSEKQRAEADTAEVRPQDDRDVEQAGILLEPGRPGPFAEAAVADQLAVLVERTVESRVLA